LLKDVLAVQSQQEITYIENTAIFALIIACIWIS